VCGIAAVYNPANPIVRELYELGMALQHRGEESAGIAVSMDGDLFVYKDRGHVDDVFHGLGKASFNSYAGIVHTRYSTTGLSGRKNAQPIRVGKVALGHNGNLVNTDELRQMFGERYDFDTTTDSELIACIFDEAPDMPTGAETASRLCKGSYNLVLLNNRGELGVFRDPSGNHPISVGFKGGALYAASEDFAFQHLDLDGYREMEPGELIVFSKGMNSEAVVMEPPGIVIGRDLPKRICAFEGKYFMMPGSTLNGKNVYEVRREVGRQLAKRFPVDADIVVPIPDSGIPYGLGYSEQSGIPFEPGGLIKNRYVRRTYTSPEGKDMDTPRIIQLTRRELSKLKLSATRYYVEGKRVVLTEDSIVRGNVSPITIQILRDAGAREVHMRIGFPPVRFPCFTGLDHAERRKLIAAPFDDPIEAGDYVAKKIGADSVRYIPQQTSREILSDSDNLCFACVDGDYWTEIPDTEQFRNALKIGV